MVDFPLIAAQAHSRNLYLVQRGNRDESYSSVVTASNVTMQEAGVLAEIMLCHTQVLVVALSASTPRTFVEQKTNRVMRMKTELTIWLIRMSCHSS